MVWLKAYLSKRNILGVIDKAGLDVAKGIIHDGKVDDGILNMVEMTFRAYDQCFACATHFAMRQTPLEVDVFKKEKQFVKTLR